MKTEDISLANKSSTNASAIVMRMTGKSSEANMTFVITCDVKQEKYLGYLLLGPKKKCAHH